MANILYISMIIIGLVIGIMGLILVIVPFLKKDNPFRQWFIEVSGATSDQIVGPPGVMVGILLIIMAWFTLNLKRENSTLYSI